MPLKYKLSIFILLCCFLQPCAAQVKKAEKDSAAMYKKIEKYSKKTKFFKALHKMVFESTETKVSNPIRKPKKKQYKSYNGKIVRQINVQTLDPFGFSETDSTRKPRNWAEKTANRLHIKSSQLAIRNLLLIRKNRPLDTLLVQESERLIRTQRYVSRVVITTKPVATNSDSVDVFVRVLDSWSLIPRGTLSPSRTTIELDERNILGSGHQLDTKYSRRSEDNANGFDVKYVVPTIKNTFIRTTLGYKQDFEGYYGKSLNIERTFYSPFTEWAGGVYVDQQFRKDTLQNAGGTYQFQNFKYYSQDVWGGRSVRIFNGNTENDRTSNLILAARALFVQYDESPTIEYDSINFYSGEKFFLAGIGISSRQYVEDKYLFNYGIIEDVPVGRVFGITGGYQLKNDYGRFYLGARASIGNYFKIGYLSSNFEYGTFFRNGKAEQTAFNFQANFFTNLMEFGKWKVRQFIKPQLILGSNRLASNGDYLTINESSGFSGTNGAGFQTYNSAGIQGFSSAVFGTKKFVLTYQTQFYSPWKLIGFRLNPFFNYTMAALGNESVGILSSKVYSKIGIGLIISNDYLVFSSFQISMAYYPTIPNEGDGLFKTNTFETTDFGLQDFEFSKPRTVIYK